MLSHEEQSVLAEIEARLREDDPELHDLLSATEVPAATPPVVPASITEPVARPRRVGLRILVAFLASMILTAAVTLVAGPELGAPVAVFGLCLAAMYALTQLGGCPAATGHAHRQDERDAEPEWRDDPDPGAA